MQVGKILSFTAAAPQCKIAAPMQPNKTAQADTFEKISFKGEGTGSITSRAFGATKTGEIATLYTITNKNGASTSVSNFGATITSIKVPDRNGNLVDVVQGYDSVTPYLEGKTGHLGGTIGPVASKTMHGKFSIDGEEYKLECNKDDGKTSSHGASNGLDVKLWSSEPLQDGVKFTYFKKDGEGGHPGNMNISVTYRFDDDNNLHIEYGATTDKNTILNLTNHSYFNLDGAQNTRENAVLEHMVQFPNSKYFTPADEISIPTGELASVMNTPFDFLVPTRLGAAIKLGNGLERHDGQSYLVSGGFDHNFCIGGYDGETLTEAAKVRSNETGIELTVKTNLPGFQFYTANNLKPGPDGKDGLPYQKRSAFCIEPQFYPNAINTEGFEKPILREGKKFERKIVYSFHS